MSLEDLQGALDDGRVSELRDILVGLSAGERQSLKTEVGQESYDQIYAAAVRRVRGPKRGRVILLNGIMGADLDVLRKRDRDRVWVNYLRLFNGRIADMQLESDGITPSDPRAEVLVRRQNKKYYLPPLLELDNHWHAQPFAYDWRLDMRHSADRLAELVESFGQGEPLHIVAHSMGGLVSRMFIQRHPDLWARCDDPDGRRRGGRLVMLGTPNHGSYTIPQVLTGEEPKVKSLAKLDRKHSPKQLLRIINTFPGSYQMLPSTLEHSVDERAKLYEVATWGHHHVEAAHFDDAGRFHEELRPVVDNERFVYVAGSDQRTPASVAIISPGKLHYGYTQAGDGRVTHALGLLPGVRTYYVRRAHGSLPIDKNVLRSIHELLQTGAASRLSLQPVVRRGGIGPYETPDEKIPAELDALISKDTGRGPKARTRLTEEEQRRVESLLLDDPDTTRAPGRKRAAASPAPGRRKRGRARSLEIEVVWGDVTDVRADVYAVGHYEGVLPQYAERALDEAISDTDDEDEHVLRQHTLRGHLRGRLGDIDLFPWPGGSRTRSVAVAGMGTPGSFSPAALRFLVQKLVWVVSNQPLAKTIATVLIGSGEGTLTVRKSARAYLLGIRDAFLKGDIVGRDYRLRFVELYRDRAEEIRDELREAEDDGLLEDMTNITIDGTIATNKGRRMSGDDALRSLAEIVANDSARGAARKHFEGLLESVESREPRLVRPLQESLRWFVENSQRTTDEAEDRPREEPIRMSFSRDRDGIRVAAITSTTTISERILRFDPALLEEVIEETAEGEEASVESLSSFVTRLLLPGEFRSWIATMAGPFIFEVDREMARVHWEMLASDGEMIRDARPLAQRAVVARQLRTTYSAAPAQALKREGPLRVLVVGDPGDPEHGDDLPGAEEEAVELARFLAELPNLDVDARIGSPNKPRIGALQDYEPAGRLDVLRELLTGDYDVLHYCGHGDFDGDDGSRAGWLFTEGLLTSREIERVESPPPLVVANACLSGRTARARGPLRQRLLESRLLPSLADEFFRRGVLNYIGTAWTVSDQGAVLFAKTFYGELLDESRNTIGEAVRSAREALYNEREIYGGLWSAYQHYGAPNMIVQR